MIPDQLHYTSINIIQYSELSQAACYFVLDLIGYGNFLLKFNCVTINQILFQIITLHYSKRLTLVQNVNFYFHNCLIFLFITLCMMKYGVFLTSCR